MPRFVGDKKNFPHDLVETHVCITVFSLVGGSNSHIDRWGVALNPGEG